MDKKVTAKDDISKKNMQVQGVKKKRKWIPENKMFKGSLKEGQFPHKPLMTTETVI